MPARTTLAMLVALLISIPTIAQDINSQLIEAAKKGDTVSIKTLLDAGADVNAKNGNGFTALMWAAGRGHTEIAQALLDAGADVNAKGNDGQTALMAATQAGHPQIAQALLEM